MKVDATLNWPSRSRCHVMARLISSGCFAMASSSVGRARGGNRLLRTLLKSFRTRSTFRRSSFMASNPSLTGFWRRVRVRLAVCGSDAVRKTVWLMTSVDDGRIGRERGESGVYVPCAICSLALVRISNILSTSSTAAVRRSVVPLARRSSSLRSPGMSGSSRDMVERDVYACSEKK